MPPHRLVVFACVAIALTGCSHVVHRKVITHTLPPSAASASPQPTKTIVHAFRRYDAGQTAAIDAQSGVGLRITVSRPSPSTTSLSRSHGYPPQHGYYLTFHLSLRNTGSQPVVINPRDFVVHIAHEGTVTSYDGNSPYSGANRQLDTTELEPGDSDRAPLTFDVRARHGRFDYHPGGTTVAVWAF